MNSLFHTAVLRYRPSIGTGESLNVGVLVLFPLQRQLRFHVPATFTRLKAAFPRLPERTLRAYVRSFAERVEKLTTQPEIFARYEGSPDTFVNNEIFLRDASSLYFSEVKTGVLFSEDLSLVAEQVAFQYLMEYAPVDESARQHDDYFLVSTFKKRLRQKNEALLREKKIRENVDLQVNEAVTFRFDFSWQNHSHHLVKPVSLDLQSADNISRKATAQYCQFALLEPQASAQKWNFDVLLARPRSGKLFGEYDKARDLLNQFKHVTLWEEERLGEYVEKAATEAEPHP